MTGEHLTFSQIEVYRAKRLPPDQIPALHEHAETCSSCREMLAAAMIAHDIDHVGEQQAVDLVAGLLSDGEKSLIDNHLAACVSCSAIVADLREFRRSIPPRVASRWPAWLLPIAAALLMVAGVSAWLALRSSGRQPVITAQLRDSGSVLQLDRTGVLTGGAALPPGAAELLKAALQSGRLPEGPPALPLETRETLRSSSNSGAAALRILAPDGVRVVSDRPEFRWTGPDGASWQVTVVDEDLNVIARSGLLHDTSWVPDAPLPRLRTLLWQVAANRNGARITAPAPPEPSPRFAIVSADAARDILTAQSSRPQSHLLLAILYTRAGLRKEAEAEVDTMAALNPGSALANSLRASLSGPR